MEALHRDGVKLCFKRARGHGTPVILVHGWCCDHGYFAPQFEHFVRLGHDVVAVDLRGHGESDKPVQDYPIPAFADDVIWLIEELALEQPILIGHSMGGVIVFDIAALRPDLASAIVMVDSTIVVPISVRPGMVALIENLEGPGHAAALRDFVRRVLFLPTDDAARQIRILDGMSAAPQHLAVSAMKGLRDHDPEFARDRITAPSLYIAGAEPTPRADMARVRGLLPTIAYGQVVGSGHFCQLEVPDQVNAMIDRFLALSRARP